jgi:hypothetical protein
MPESALSLLRDAVLSFAAAAGKHIVAVLRILQLVLEKLPATFAEGAHRAALVHMVMLLRKLPEQQE